MNWRPLNESAEDVRREALVLDDAVAAMGFAGWIKLSPILYEIDAAIHDGGDLIAWAEVKVRNRLYDTVLLSVAKALALYRLHLATHLPGYFILHTPEGGIMVHRIGPVYNYAMKIAGNARGQNGDIEPCIFIPRDRFTPLAPALTFDMETRDAI